MKAIYLFSVWLHIMAAMIWLGGMIFLAMVVVPTTREAAFRNVAGRLIHRTGLRFRWIGWLCLGLLLLTGAVNLGFRGYAWTDVWSGRLWQGPFGQALGIKLLLVAIIILLSAFHDFVVGPEATAMWRADPGSPDAHRLRRRASWFGRLNLLLGLTVVAFGIFLVRGWP